MKTSEAKAQIRAANDALSLTQIAFSDCLAGRVEWFGRAPFRVGVTRADGAAGGVLVIHDNGMIAVDYAEEYFPRTLSHISAVITGHDTETNRELQSRRDVIEAAQACIRRAQSAA